MVIFIAGRNTEKYVSRCINSVIVALKAFGNGRIVFMDDASEDKSVALAKSILSASGLKYDVIVSPKRKGKVALYLEALAKCAGREVIFEMDGDDWLTRKDALQLVAKKYLFGGAWCTWGRDTSGKCPVDMVKNDRNGVWYEHPRTCLAALMKAIKKEDLKYQGEYADVCTDRFLFYPPFEMAAGRIACVNEVIYQYNGNLPTNVKSVDRDRQIAALYYIVEKPRYPKLARLP